MSTIKQLGTYKAAIADALFNSKELKELLINGTKGKTATSIRKQFRQHVNPHLYIDETIDDADSYIFYEVYIPAIHPQIKTMAIKLVCIVQKDTIGNFDSATDERGEPIYAGNRVDAMAQMVEQALCSDEKVARSFGIGKLDLSAVNYYIGQHHYGLVLDFKGIADFR